MAHLLSGVSPRTAPVDHAEGTVKLEAEDVGFADIELVRLTQWPWLEIRITARDVDIQQKGIEQMLMFIERVLHSDITSGGFGLTYDFRLLKNPSVAGLLTIAKWSATPERRDFFLKRCVFCQACVPSGWKFTATKAAMSAFFLIAAPTCKTYLTADFDITGKTAVCFEPPSCCQTTAAEDSTVEEASSNRNQDVQRASASCFRGLSSCFSIFKTRFRRRDSEALRKAMAQIEQLRQENLDLQSRLDELSRRLLQVETAVPWAKTLEQLNGA